MSDFLDGAGVEIIDPHVHFLDPARFGYPWLEDPEFARIRQRFLPEDLRSAASAVGISGCVHVQAEVSHETDPVAETAWIASLGADYPGFPLACVAYADLRAADLDDVLTRHHEFGIVTGIRQEAWFDTGSKRADIPSEDLLSDPRWRAGYRRLAHYGLTFDLLVWPWQLPDAMRLAAENPGVMVVVEHLGLPDLTHPDGLAVWRRGIRAVAGVRHAFLKISALAQINRAWTDDLVAPLIREAIEVMGAERCMFASNYPVEALASDYQRLWTTYRAVVADFSPADRQDLFGGTARRVYLRSPGVD
jgi:predicted TIM-barrel fold metal-dependent hydrolase